MVKIICHFDGHGVSNGALAARYFGATLSDIIAYKYPVTSPENFHRLAEYVNPTILYSDTTYVVVDIPINVKDADLFMRGFHAIFQNARARFPGARISIMYFDHHATNLQFIQQIPNFVKYVHFPDALSLGLFFAKTEDEQRLAVIGAICDRDKAVLSHPLFQRESERLLRAADGLDYLVRYEPERALEACFNLNIAVLEAAAGRIPTPPSDVEVLDGCVLCLAPLDEMWSPKQLERLAIQHEVPYAVGYLFLRRTNTWVARAITLWTSDAPPVLNIIRDVIGSRTHYGHPAAPVISAVDENDARRLARMLAERISEYVREQRISARKGQLEDFMRLLAEILDEQRRLYREYLELKRRQVELLERAEGVRRYD